mmetsp:Transcript_25649/g.42813  ORF Transcript_25649/g.42813 Transcript_25649/m.42813 type:complete len:329 (+) Transcript_25649:93-1079(+)
MPDVRVLLILFLHNNDQNPIDCNSLGKEEQNLPEEPRVASERERERTCETKLRFDSSQLAARCSVCVLPDRAVGHIAGAESLLAREEGGRTVDHRAVGVERDCIGGVDAHPVFTDIGRGPLVPRDVGKGIGGGSRLDPVGAEGICVVGPQNTSEGRAQEVRFFHHRLVVLPAVGSLQDIFIADTLYIRRGAGLVTGPGGVAQDPDEAAGGAEGGGNGGAGGQLGRGGGGHAVVPSGAGTQALCGVRVGVLRVAVQLQIRRRSGESAVGLRFISIHAVDLVGDQGGGRGEKLEVYALVTHLCRSRAWSILAPESMHPQNGFFKGCLVVD